MAQKTFTQILFDTLGSSGVFHHAYCLTGPREGIETVLNSYVSDVLEMPENHPDRVHFHFDSLGVDESRTIGEFASRRASAGGRRILIITTYGITREAQNAFLKLFEEPGIGLSLFLIIPSADTLLPTLLSRLSIIRFQNVGGETDEDGPIAFADAFRRAPLPARFALVKKFAAEITDEERPRNDALTAAAQLERIVAAEPRDTAHATFLRDLIHFRADLGNRSSSIKMIFEHLALSLPPPKT